MVIVTVYAREEVMPDANELGLRRVLIKPVSPPMLFDTLVSALRGEQGASARELRTPSMGSALAGARILLVEDNVLNQELALELLGAAGIRVSADGTLRCRRSINA